jgi:hypothetical protein
MSQNDFSIADQPGASFLSELNSQIQALATLSSGPTAPTTTYAYQFWYDTTNSLLKMRNGGNTQWITIGNPATDTSVDMYIANALRARLNDTGLGVGVSNPAYALDVSGDVNVTGVFRVGGVDIQNSHRSGLVNMFRNPFMEVAQRGTSGTITAGTGAYTLDGWAVTASGGSVSWQQAGSVLSGSTYSTTSLGLLGASGLTGCIVYQRIESNMAGQISGRRVTVQFVISNQTGASITPTIATYYPTAIDNHTSVVTDLGITSLQTIASGATATVAYTFVTNGLASRGYGFDLNFGSQLNGAGKNVYISAADIRVTPDAPLGLNNAPPRPEYRPIPTEIGLCEWYLETGRVYGYGIAGGAGNSRAAYRSFRSRKRTASPAVIVSNITYGGAGANSLVVEQVDSTFFGARVTTTSSGNFIVDFDFLASSEL